MNAQEWYWAARRDGPVGEAFVIENGQDALWRRVRGEIDADRRAMWMAIHKGASEPDLGHILHLMLTVVPTYRVSHNRFVFEAAKIPCFARFLRDAPVGLSEFVSNSAYPDVPMVMEPYTVEAAARLGAIASDTLGIKDDWHG